MGSFLKLEAGGITGALGAAVLLCLALPAHANRQGFGSDFKSGNDAMVDKATTYYPEMGGKMEGGCEGGGPKPMNPCKYLLDDFVAGKVTDCVVAATQRAGGSASLYGCKAEAPFISQAVGKPVVLCFADVYAKSESYANRKVSKFDVATKIRSPLINRVNGSGGGRVVCNGRLPNTQNGDQRKPERKEEALSDSPGGGAPPGGGEGGGDSGGGEGEPAEYPEPLSDPSGPGITGTARSSTSSSQKVSRWEPAREPEKKAEPPKPADGPSDVTRFDAGPHAYSSGPADEETGTAASSAGGDSSSAKAAAGTAGSGGGLGGGSGSSSSGAGKKGAASHQPSLDEQGYSMGGGGGLSSRVPASPAAGASGEGSEEAPGEGGEYAGEQGEGEWAEEPSGVAEMDGDNLFARVHAYYVRIQEAGIR